MGAERLADFINDREQVELADVLVTDLAGSKAIDLHALLVSRDEILAVHASGPRGSSGRRTRTRTHPVVAKLGPYEVRGYIHALPGSDPISGLRRRPPMVALTEARIDYLIGTEARTHRAAALLINRELADWIVEGEDEEDVLPELEITRDPHDPLVKDFTGAVLGHTGDPDAQVA